MGNKLFSEVTELTGLPEELIGAELKSLLANKGVAPEQMTMESLREALADYLNQVVTEMGALDEDMLELSPGVKTN
ncbi:MAG: hypothetical protein AB7K68_10585 [Bacteriovoracia bacterium]